LVSAVAAHAELLPYAVDGLQTDNVIVTLEGVRFVMPKDIKKYR
jgi:hypothetical protein